MITKVKWKNHPILKNLELDFTDENGKPYNTIVLAGENGTGKTTVLDTLSVFLGLGSIVPFEYIEYLVDNDSFKIFYDSQTVLPEFGFHNRLSKQSGKIVSVESNRNSHFEQIVEDKNDIRHYGVAYSKARSGFIAREIKSSSTEQIDSNKYFCDESDDNTNEKQLLVDLTEQDNAAWMNIAKTNQEISFEEFRKKYSKLNRFEKAFDGFFEGLSFERIDEENLNEKAVVFNKNGQDILIDSLSSGEKQIVYRATKLLRNAKALEGGVVLVDEPELSLHPMWQQKILGFYRELFTTEFYKKQFAQMIFATHSEYVIKSALEDSDNVLIIVLKEKYSKVEPKRVVKSSVLPTITAAETNYLAFDILSIDYHIQLYGYVQEMTDSRTIKKCDEFIENHSLYKAEKHEKHSAYKKFEYNTICTYIRNAIDHPDNCNTYSEQELRISTELLIEICKDLVK